MNEPLKIQRTRTISCNYSNCKNCVISELWDGQSNNNELSICECLKKRNMSIVELLNLDDAKCQEYNVTINYLEESRAIMCHNQECDMVWVTDLWDGDSHGNVLFVCQCLAHLDQDELLQFDESDADEYGVIIVYYITDTIDNIRKVRCGGMKCRVSFGNNLNVHCISCHDSRGYVSDSEEEESDDDNSDD